MGSLVYGGPTSIIEFDDRLLAHLQIVILTKLRRSESFVFTWETPRENGSGSNSIWISPTVPIHFSYPVAVRPPINRGWVEALMHTANSVAGLRIVDEPVASVESRTKAKTTNDRTETQ
jgi:hypothetical protein